MREKTLRVNVENMQLKVRLGFRGAGQAGWGTMGEHAAHGEAPRRVGRLLRCGQLLGSVCVWVGGWRTMVEPAQLQSRRGLVLCSSVGCLVGPLATPAPILPNLRGSPTPPPAPPACPPPRPTPAGAHGAAGAAELDRGGAGECVHATLLSLLAAGAGDLLSLAC